jgi:hypothetical protein
MAAQLSREMNTRFSNSSIERDTTYLKCLHSRIELWICMIRLISCKKTFGEVSGIEFGPLSNGKPGEGIACCL